MTPPVYLNSYFFLLVLVLIQKLGQRRQSGVHFLFTSAAPLVEIDAAAGADALAVRVTEGLGIHLQDELGPGQVTHIDAPVLQKDNVVVFLVPRQLPGQHTLVADCLGLVEGLQAPVADGLEDCAGGKVQKEHPRDVPHLAGYHHRVLGRPSAAEVHIG